MGQGSGSGDAMEMMPRKKTGQRVNLADSDSEDESQEARNEFKSTSADAVDMQRVGKEQQLVRHFRVLSMASFVAVATAAWELPIFNLSQGLTNGGLPMLTWGMLWNFVGFIPIYMSMAELASMAPVAGAQYHWVSEFAPASIQKPLSYFTGYASSPSFVLCPCLMILP
jgi:hypothetical protein